MLKGILCGGIAGCAAKTALAPLERARIMLQVRGGTMTGRLAAVMAQEGFFGLWAGNTANLVRVFPMRGIAFAANDFFGALNDSKAYKFVAGGCSGLLSVAVTYPLDLVRGRQATGSSSTVNFGRAIVNFVKADGVASLWRGAGPTLLGSIPFEGLRFGIVELLKTSSSSSSSPRSTEGTTHASMTKASHGAFAGLVAGLATFPNDTIRRMLQQQDCPYRGYFDCAITVYKKHGLRRFYFGVIPSLLKAVPSAAIQFGTFEYLKRTLFSIR